MVARAGGPTIRPRVLVIDDDVAMCSMLETALTARGYIVATASHGAAALDVLRDFAPAVILLDLSMPVMDGRSFAERYKRDARPPASLIVLSGNRDVAEQAARLGAIGVLRKPFGLDRLFAMILACLAAS